LNEGQRSTEGRVMSTEEHQSSTPGTCELATSFSPQISTRARIRSRRKWAHFEAFAELLRFALLDCGSALDFRLVLRRHSTTV